MRIVSRWDPEKVLYEGEAESLRSLLEQADLTGADLTGADLTGANLVGVGGLSVER